MMSWRATRLLLGLVCKEHLEKCPSAVCRGFLFKEKRKRKKGVFELIASIGCVEKRSRSNLLLTRLRKKMGKVERF